MYKAIKTFAGIKIAMKKGDTVEYIEDGIAKDLLRAGYIEEIKEIKPVPVEEAKKIVEKVKEELKKEEVVEETKEVEKPKRTTTRKKK